MLSRFELRRFRGLLPVAALLFALFVPVIYGVVYLYANWDPYGRLSALPVAIVDADRPVDYQGETISAGRDIADELVSQQTFDWVRTDAADASAGLADGRYYLVLEIPATLSSDLVSAGTADPRRAGITLRRDDANGFVIGSVTASAQSKIENAVNATAVDAYFKAVFADLGKIRSGMVDARDGADRLASGLGTARQGSGSLATGTSEAASGAHRLASGAAKLDAAQPALTAGASDLAAGLDRAKAGSASLADGARQVADGTQQLADTVVPVLTKVEKVQGQVATRVDAANDAVQRVNGVVNGTPPLSDRLAAALAKLDAAAAADPTFAASDAYTQARAALVDARTKSGAIEDASATAAADSAAANALVQKLVATDAAGQAKAKLTALNDGAHQVASGASSLASGLADADAGAHRLADGVRRAAAGVGQLDDGASALASGLDRLQAGAGRLDDGLGELASGARRLADGLADGVRNIPRLTASQSEAAASTLSQPVEVTMDVAHPAHVYGRGLAPLFFSIAMWVFGISGFLVMRPISGRLLAGRLRPLRLAVAAWVPFGSVAVAGALLMLGITWLGLGLDPVDPAAALGVTVLSALVFSGIAHLMRTALGLPGSALLLVWLVLQLSATGGTYPTAVLPSVFTWLHPLMPITYTIDAYRVAISGGSAHHLGIDVAVLVGFGLAALVLDVLAVMRRQRFSIADLHPPLRH